MGYTHYITGLETLSEKDTGEWIKACNGIIALYNKKNKGDNAIVNCGKDTFVPESTKVFANGKGDNGHETLYITHNLDGEFCKTARKPYDSAVVACYLWAHRKFQGVTFSSDGVSKDHAEGKRLLKKYLDNPPLNLERVVQKTKYAIAVDLTVMIDPDIEQLLFDVSKIKGVIDVSYDPYKSPPIMVYSIKLKHDTEEVFNSIVSLTSKALKAK